MESNINLYMKREIRKKRENHPHESALSQNYFVVIVARHFQTIGI
jgi:hypothetical protein